ncbi:hypothetical protein NFI96_007250, partial [Prochilodus magdalenae]
PSLTMDAASCSRPPMTTMPVPTPPAYPRCFRGDPEQNSDFVAFGTRQKRVEAAGPPAPEGDAAGPPAAKAVAAGLPAAEDIAAGPPAPIDFGVAPETPVLPVVPRLLSLRLGRVPATWKTTCLIPVPKKAHPKELNDYRPVALTSHVMKTMEQLLLNHLRPQVHPAEDPLQFAYREKVGVEDAILYLLHRAHSHLDKGGYAVRVMFFDFSSAFNTIQPLLLRDKLMKMEVDMHLVTWITDYLTGRPQHVRIRDCSSDTVISSTGAPQGTVLSPVLFTLYTSDFKYNSELCHMQKFSDDTAIVGCA